MDTIPQDILLKQCSQPTCKRWYPLTTKFFKRNRTTKDGFYNQCRACYNKNRREWESRPAYRERRNADAKVYHHRPEVQARDHAYRDIRRARKRAVSGTHTAAQIQDLLQRQKQRCYYCNDKFEKRNGRYIYHVDHTFPINRVAGTSIPANDVSYLVLACPTCNLRKGDKYPWEFFEGGKLL